VTFLAIAPLRAASIGRATVGESWHLATSAGAPRPADDGVVRPTRRDGRIGASYTPAVVDWLPAYGEATASAPGLPSLVGRDPGVRVVSFSQNAEDVRLWRVFRDVENGFYVDIGANDPATWSVTKLFYDAGWNGINVEPGPTYNLLVEARARDVNVRAAVGLDSGTSDFWIAYPETCLSTCHPDVHAHVPELIDRFERVTVDATRLDQLLATHASDRAIQFLKIDVEGAEAEVIASSDWTRFRPEVVVVEAVATMDSRPTHEAWEPMLLAADYHFAVFDGLNRFYVADECAHLTASLAYPIGVLDRFVTIEQLRLERSRLELQAAMTAAERRAAKLGAEVEQLHRQLDATLRSNTWRAGRLVWHAAAPVRALRRRVIR
jgi:FkbM family methyltransferase